MHDSNFVFYRRSWLAHASWPAKEKTERYPKNFPNGQFPVTSRLILSRRNCHRYHTNSTTYEASIAREWRNGPGSVQTCHRGGGKNTTRRGKLHGQNSEQPSEREERMKGRVETIDSFCRWFLPRLRSEHTGRVASPSHERSIILSLRKLPHQNRVSQWRNHSCCCR